MHREKEREQMGKWVQKGGYRKKKCTKRKYTFHSVENMCMVIRKKNSKDPFRELPASIRILGLYNFFIKLISDQPCCIRNHSVGCNGCSCRSG